VLGTTKEYARASAINQLIKEMIKSNWSKGIAEGIQYILFSG